MAAKADTKKSAMIGLIGTLAGLTALAGGGGFAVGKLVTSRFKPAPPPVADAAAKAPPPYSNGIDIRELPPLVTNLSGPPGTEVRLQVALVYGKKPLEDIKLLTAQIGDDLVAFLKTLTLAQLQGASGLQNLREDLNERAAIRSQGTVREVIIEAIVTQ